MVVKQLFNTVKVKPNAKNGRNGKACNGSAGTTIALLKNKGTPEGLQVTKEKVPRVPDMVFPLQQSVKKNFFECTPLTTGLC